MIGPLTGTISGRRATLVELLRSAMTVPSRVRLARAGP